MPKPVSQSSSPAPSQPSQTRTTNKASHNGFIAGEANVLGSQAISANSEGTKFYRPVNDFVKIKDKFTSPQAKKMEKLANHIMKVQAKGEAPFHAYGHINAKK
jgi:hypothetical protein